MHINIILVELNFYRDYNIIIPDFTWMLTRILLMTENDDIGWSGSWCR